MASLFQIRKLYLIEYRPIFLPIDYNTITGKLLSKLNRYILSFQVYLNIDCCIILNGSDPRASNIKDQDIISP